MFLDRNSKYASLVSKEWRWHMVREEGFRVNNECWNCPVGNFVGIIGPCWYQNTTSLAKVWVCTSMYYVSGLWICWSVCILSYVDRERKGQMDLPFLLTTTLALAPCSIIFIKISFNSYKWKSSIHFFISQMKLCGRGHSEVNKLWPSDAKAYASSVLGHRPLLVSFSPII